MATMELDDPASTAAWSATTTGNVEKVVEAKGGEGDATPEQLAIREVNTGDLRLRRRRRCSTRWTSSTPTTRRASCTCPTCCRSCARPARRSPAHLDHRPDAHARRQRPRRARARSASSRSSASTTRHSAQRRDDRRPRQHAHRRRRRRSARTRSIEPGTSPARATRRSARTAAIGPHTTITDSTLGDGVSDPALLPRPGARRRLRHDRPVRLPAPRRPPAARRPRPARSWRSRTRPSARARRSRTCPTSGTPTSARTRTSAPATSPPTTTASSKHRTTIGANVRTSVDTAFVAPGRGRRWRVHRSG